MSVFISLSHHNKMPWTDWLKEQGFISHSYRDWKSQIRVPAGSVSSENSLLDLQIATCALCPLMALCRCAQMEMKRGSKLFDASPYTGTNAIVRAIPHS